MNRALYSILSLALVGGLGYYFLMPKCEQPDKITVQILQIQCANSIDLISLRETACLKIYQQKNCSLDRERDGNAVRSLFIKVVNECTDRLLADQNLCSDNIERL